MCLATEQGRPFIADKEIKVYKECRITDNKLFGYYQRDYQYSKNETSELILEKGLLNNYVNVGLHANIDLYSWRHNTMWIIPKGAKYYISKNKTEIVSNKLNFGEFIGESDTIRNGLLNYGINWRKKGFYKKLYDIFKNI